MRWRPLKGQCGTEFDLSGGRWLRLSGASRCSSIRVLGVGQVPPSAGGGSGGEFRGSFSGASADPRPVQGRRLGRRQSRLVPLSWSFAHATLALQYRIALGSNFASHISLSSAKARRHCSPFSHALIAAL